MNNMVEIAGLILFLIGLYGLAARRNIIKSIIALGIMDIGIILFFLGIRYVPGAAAPMTTPDDAAAAWAYAQTADVQAGEGGTQESAPGAASTAPVGDGSALEGAPGTVSATQAGKGSVLEGAPGAASATQATPACSEAVWADAVPQALMITAIVIGVAVTAVALMMFIALYHRYGTTNWKTAHNIRKEERRN